jgi:xylan 1,4-beta-xylosidase
MMNMIQNPVLPGFHADPSICRVGNDYYIATSTFEWWPAVRIHHSQDLVNWTHCSYAVTRPSQLNLLGHPDSSGVWAPCLSYAHGQFWLIYTDARSVCGAYKDTHNYLVTAKNIEGPWSEPIYMNSSGFDPSLFHDDNGRTWFLNQEWNHQPGANNFNGILLQEYDREKQCLLGPIKNIFRGTSLGVVEGPHLYRRDGWYYLLTAEGGTFYEHAVTLARSRTIDGVYEVMPGNPLLTAQFRSETGLQRTGHASWVETADGDWYMAHLCGRPLEWSGPNLGKGDFTKGYQNLHCILGRETGIQKLQWNVDGWPTLSNGSNTPSWEVPAPNGVQIVPRAPSRAVLDNFDKTELSGHFNSLRIPVTDQWLSLTERSGHVRIKGRESLMSMFEQSLIARRLQDFNCVIETVVDFEPDHFQQMAGLVAYYNTSNHAYLHVSADVNTGKRILRLTVNDCAALKEPVPPVALSDGPVKLRIHFQHDTFQYTYATHEENWKTFGPALPSAMLSDEYATRSRDGYFYSFGFTGAFVGIACQDLSGLKKHADFDYFNYQPL